MTTKIFKILVSLLVAFWIFNTANAKILNDEEEKNFLKSLNNNRITLAVENDKIDYSKLEIDLENDVIKSLKIEDNFISKDDFLLLEWKKDWVYRLLVDKNKKTRLQFEVIWDNVKAYYLTNEFFKEIKKLSTANAEPKITELTNPSLTEKIPYLANKVDLKENWDIVEISGYAPNKNSLVLEKDCRVFGVCDETEKKEISKDEKNSENKSENKSENSENKKNEINKLVEKELNWKKYFYFENKNIICAKNAFDKVNSIEDEKTMERIDFTKFVLDNFCFDYSEDTKNINFEDVKNDSSEAKIISSGVKNDFITDKNKKFRKNDKVSKIEALWVLYKVSWLVSEKSPLNFIDAKAKWQENVLSQSENLNIISLPKDKKFNPNFKILWKEIKNIFNKIIKLY